MTAICRNLELDELRQLLDWAANEGWNPGVDDHIAFYRADPTGYFGIFDGNSLIAGISMVKPAESSNHAFLGLYICAPSHRGKGYGIKVWQTAIESAKDCTIALDGVVEQQANYRQSGFEFAYRNIRFQGTTDLLKQKASEALSGFAITNPDSDDRQQLIRMDAEHGGYSRDRYLNEWLTVSDNRLTSLAYTKDTGRLAGFGTIRTCQDHHKIGPLQATSVECALSVTAALCRQVGAEAITVDIPEPNADAIKSFGELGLTPVFETARMYRGTPPKQQLDRIFGVATLELG